MSRSVVVIGAQWGDEGKGKIVDLLTDKASVVVRFQGGHNAGHTLVIETQHTVLHLIPSGVMRPEVTCLVGHGVVLAPDAIIHEIDMLTQRGLDLDDRLFLSVGCPLILPVHAALDKAREAAAGSARAIGTTGRGIGPAYEDKVARRAVRLGDLRHPDRFAEKLEVMMDLHNFTLEKYLNAKPVDFQKSLDDALAAGEVLAPRMADVPALLHAYRRQGRNVLYEGAQGTLLDVDQGTYPYVTSSTTTAAAAASGAGVGPTTIDYVLGIAKAYATRVGAGPFPTELFDDVGELLARQGHEFGATTGRPRRCGWLDTVALRRAVRSNGISGLCITKLDVLDELEEIKIGVAYEVEGTRLEDMPAAADELGLCRPVYETHPGWQCSTVGMRSREGLPPQARAYLARIEELCEVPVDIVSTGPDRVDTAVARHPFV